MVPVVLFTYNRPAQTKKVLEALRSNRIPLLYVFADGPREGDEDKVQQIYKLVDAIDWTKVIFTKQPKNIGLSASIKLGLDGVFKRHESAVVIEDDIKVTPNFYDYMVACLSEYKDVKYVAGVTGLLYPFQFTKADSYKYDTFLFPRFSSWGWATWRHIWQNINWNRDELIEDMQTKSAPLELGGRDMRETYKHYMGGALSGAWDVDFSANMLLNKQVFVWPTYNMVENLGLLEGTHASGEAPNWSLKYGKRMLRGSYKFFNEPLLEASIYSDFLSFFEGAVQDNEVNNDIRRNTLTTKNLTRRALGKAKRTIIKPAVSVEEKPDPSDYSTVTEPLEVPVQKEAYFIALNNYIKEGDRVLDVGSGLGYGLNLLAIKAREVTGVDIDKKAIDYAKVNVCGKNPKLKELKVFDGYHLPYADNSFDVITSVDVLEHVEKYDEFIDELLRVAKKAVLISTPNRRAEYTNPDGTPRNPWHLREWSRGELSAILKKHSAKVDWYHVNGPWEGPFTVSRTVKPDTMTLTPVLVKR